jgi:hypothetical protein
MAQYRVPKANASALGDKYIRCLLRIVTVTMCSMGIAFPVSIVEVGR